MSRKSYNDEFKIAAAKLAREPGCSVRKAAKSLGVDEGSIRDWVRKFAPAVAPSSPDASQRNSAASSSASARRTAGSSWSARF